MLFIFEDMQVGRYTPKLLGSRIFRAIFLVLASRVGTIRRHMPEGKF